MDRSAEKTLVIGIGAQKSGTSWLANYLVGHPDVFMYPLKELHYFDALLRPDLYARLDREAVDRLKNFAAAIATPELRSRPDLLAQLEGLRARVRMIADETAYLDYFLSQVGNKKAMGEITPAYSILDRAGYAKIAGLYPRVKFIFLMRNPVDRFWSQLRFDFVGDETPISRQDICGAMASPHYQLRTDYKRTLSELFAAVEKDDVFVEFYENLFNDAAVLRLCTFLGIDFLPGSYGEHINVTPGADMPSDARAEVYAMYSHVYDYVSEMFAGAIPQSWLRDMVAHTGRLPSH